MFLSAEITLDNFVCSESGLLINVSQWVNSWLVSGKWSVGRWVGGRFESLLLKRK